jgi:hypothetical protein
VVSSVFGGAEKGGATDARVPLVECTYSLPLLPVWEIITEIALDLTDSHP